MDPQQLISETLETWAIERPELNFEAMGIGLKFDIIATASLGFAGEVIADLGVNLGEFDVLATLRRNGKNGVLTPKEIAAAAMVSPSGLTHRLTQLENMGHIIRQNDPNDRRSSLVRLTPQGRKIADKGIERVAQRATQLINGFSADEVEALSTVLDKVLAMISQTITAP
ncbi:MAG: MarR family transcriptional regulator [Ilumatobacteraceae bacterium]|nr:MarR family transcriptional regulator [Ilumatobacteraceae bacterium]